MNKKFHTLIIEDDATAILIAKSLLSFAGCTSDVAHDGTEAIAKFHQDYDLILLDIGLPDYDGLELANLIRNHPSAIARVPIVALTAHANDSKNRERAKTIGVNGLFGKPFSSDLCDMLLEGIASGDTDFWEK